MSIDWITVAAQIANFLVLVWLLKRFLYRPILNGIDAREAEIAKRMSEAGEAQNVAAAAEQEYRAQKEQLLEDKRSMLEQALMSTEKQRKELLEEGRQKLSEEQQVWRNYMEQERHRFTGLLQRAGEETLLELCRKALHELADDTLEQAIVRKISAELKTISRGLIEAASDHQEAVATTRDTLPGPAREYLKNELKKTLPNTALRFSIDPQQAPGLTLRIGGAQLAWTIDSYTEEIDTLLKQRLALNAPGRMQSSG